MLAFSKIAIQVRRCVPPLPSSTLIEKFLDAELA
jgi:hypothetical protein